MLYLISKGIYKSDRLFLVYTLLGILQWDLLNYICNVVLFLIKSWKLWTQTVIKYIVEPFFYCWYNDTRPSLNFPHGYNYHVLCPSFCPFITIYKLLESSSFNNFGNNLEKKSLLVKESCFKCNYKQQMSLSLWDSWQMIFPEGTYLKSSKFCLIQIFYLGNCQQYLKDHLCN